MPPFLQALRPHQWVKNLLVLVPLFFTDQAFSLSSWLAALTAFGSFCFAASSIYLLNDILDRHEDALHPKKKHRPIASGRLPVRAAWAELVITLSVCFGLACLVPVTGRSFLIWPTSYLTLNVAYSFYLKRLVIVDCMCIAIGFQLRVMAGAAAIGVDASKWLQLCTFFFALFLAFCKRYEEVGRQTEAAGQTRKTMSDYSLPFLNMLIGPLAALSILSYALYTVSPETVARHRTDQLIVTVPFVCYGVFRYLFLVYSKSEGGDPAKLLFRDIPLVLSGVLYVGVVLLILSMAPAVV
ncbi:MAG: 4-hydroxybenzoate polyprenyltransferase [Hyphomicrobiaceae bacterium]|jgi:4-hydroxybenzoate polyprenyltransferase